ncbi:unnamed protein product [Mycena citricolor]|uniref:Actin interacting protein 3 C-terminal domain-containing protein n=1 Tax=Mycena citricolor TaxID=2018698 RepID=A0AAD2Q435_9AGAR|nr:unnamed protein product [Mycena citricolor]
MITRPSFWARVLWLHLSRSFNETLDCLVFFPWADRSQARSTRRRPTLDLTGTLSIASSQRISLQMGSLPTTFQGSPIAFENYTAGPPTDEPLSGKWNGHRVDDLPPELQAQIDPADIIPNRMGGRYAQTPFHSNGQPHAPGLRPHHPSRPVRIVRKSRAEKAKEQAKARHKASERAFQALLAASGNSTCPQCIYDLRIQSRQQVAASFPALYADFAHGLKPQIRTKLPALPGMEMIDFNPKPMEGQTTDSHGVSLTEILDFRDVLEGARDPILHGSADVKLKIQHPGYPIVVKELASNCEHRPVSRFNLAYSVAEAYSSFFEHNKFSRADAAASGAEVSIQFLHQMRLVSLYTTDHSNYIAHIALPECSTFQSGVRQRVCLSARYEPVRIIVFKSDRAGRLQEWRLFCTSREVVLFNNRFNVIMKPAVESAVTRLLVSIKQLLESLTQWSVLKIDENSVSDVYVRLGNDFNAAVAAFAAYNIDMAELMTVPDDLRNVLEQCLAEDASQDNLELYLPTVRQIITNLLQGLRGKQSIYRRIMSDHRRSEQSTSERTDSRSSRSKREGSHRSQLSRSGLSDENPPTPTSARDSTSSRRSAGHSSRRRDPGSPLVGNTMNGEAFIGGFAPALVEPTPTEPTPEREVADSPEPQSRRNRNVPPPIDPPPAESVDQYPSNSPNDPTLPMPSPAPNVPASVKRYSLVDKPLATPQVVVEPSTPGPDMERLNGTVSPPPPDTPPIDALQAPAVANSLAALKKSDTLERRASKRFSTYNISKMTGAIPTRERSVRTGSGAANRRSLAAGSALTPGDLAVLTEVDDEEPAAPTLVRKSSNSRSRASPSGADRSQAGTPPVPPLPSTPSRTPEPVLAVSSAAASVESLVAPAPPPPATQLIVFLQLGREVKKVTIDRGLSVASLRMLFVDKFSYNPGLENFPAIYIRDPASGVQYELEDMDEVKEKCLLSLNIEPLDQIKQHIDAQISTLSQDIKELKSVVNNNGSGNSGNRQSIHLPAIVGQPLAESTPAPNRPTDRQFQNVARRLSRFVGDASSEMPPFSTSPPPMPSAQSTLQPQMTGGSVLSDYSSRVVTDLKTQFDEVQNLRRDLGVLRQLYTEFMKSTKDSLGSLRAQTKSVKQLANTNVGGARGYIDTGKKKLDNRSQNVLTEIEKLQDAVENVKDDVVKRHITPKMQYLKTIKNDIEALSAEMASLKEHIDTVKPMWKKTWEEELQNIVDEQGFLNHQEQFLEDLIEDQKALVEVYGHVEKIISIRGPGSVGSRNGRKGFRPPPIDEGHNGLSTVMLEIRGAAIDPEKRMKAIEASQKNRQKELASRSDEMQAELTDFVTNKKLKMTGGAEEAERVRQRRNEMTLKAMFSSGGVTEMGSMSGDSSM